MAAQVFQFVKPTGGQRYSKRRVQAAEQANWGRVMAQADYPPETGVHAFLVHDGQSMQFNPDLSVRQNLDLFEKTHGLQLPSAAELRVQVVPEDVVGKGHERVAA